MKKIFAHVAFALGFAPLAFAASVNTPYGPFLGVDGGTLHTGSGIQLGADPLAQACSEVLVATASVAITAGDALVLGGSAGPVSVAKTTNVADELFVGIAVSSAASGKPVQVCQAGLVRAYVSGGAVAGSKYVTSGTSGSLVLLDGSTGAGITALSTTAVAFQALQTTSGNYVIGRVLGR